jgi:hypothetical protein
MVAASAYGNCENALVPALSVIPRCPFVYSETMFARRVSVQCIDPGGKRHACSIRHIDSFAMRNFTNDAVFDDTFPAADGLLEIGHKVPLDRLQTAMEDWFHRKGYLKPGERLELAETGSAWS